MKSKILLIIAIAVIALIVVLLFVFHARKEVKIGMIKSFYYTYTQGYMVDAYVRYEVRYEKNKYVAKIKPYGIPEDKLVTIEIDDSFLKKLEELLEKYQVGSWNGFHENDKNVMDGDSFSLSITMEDEQEISASGYMRWPKNYREFSKEVDALFETIHSSKS